MKDTAMSTCQEKFESLEKTHKDVQSKLQGTLESRKSAVDFLHLRMSQTASLSIGFSVWVTVWLQSRLLSTRADLNRSFEDASSLKATLGATEESRDGYEKQLKRAHNFCGGDKVSLPNEEKHKLKVMLLAVFTAWNLKKLETQLDGVVTELDIKKHESSDAVRRLEPLQSAVDFSQRRSGRRAALSAVFCSWSTQYLQHMTHRALRREADVKRRTDEKLELLRDTVMRLVDEHVEGDVTGSIATPISLRMRRGDSRRNSALSLASSFAAESPWESEEDPSLSHVSSARRSEASAAR